MQRRLGIGSWWAHDFEDERRIVSAANEKILASLRPPVYAVYAQGHGIVVRERGNVLTELFADSTGTLI